MNILSLFDGMSCGRIALERAGIPVTNYYASEIDKYAMKVSAANYPDIIQLGSVSELKNIDWRDQKIDLVIGGSPCQGFSFAGKQLNFDDPRSALFFEYVRVLNEIREVNPDVKFLLENVKMKKEYQDVISGYLEIQPFEINSALVSAQNRKRLYWTNIPQNGIPEDKGILLKDIIEKNIPFNNLATSINTNPSGNGMNGKIHEINKKSPCLTTNKGEGYKITGMIKSGVANDIKGFDSIKRVYSIEGKSPTLTSMQGGHRQPKVSLNKATIIGQRLDENGTRKDYDKSVPITQVLEVRASNIDKSGCLTTVDKDNVLTNLPVGRYPDVYKNNIPYRKLTPIECERLQTVPDNYTNHVSNSQRYKMLGNGWTVDVIAHIFQGLKPLQ